MDKWNYELIARSDLSVHRFALTTRDRLPTRARHLSDPRDCPSADKFLQLHELRAHCTFSLRSREEKRKRYLWRVHGR